MKKRELPIIIAATLFFYLSVNAEQKSNEVLKTIVEIRATIPADARTSRALGTEREGHGIVIDSDGHILTIGYLIIEAETIQVITADGQSFDAHYVGYDHSSGLGVLRANMPLGVTPIELGQSSEIKEGEPILVAGHGGPQAVQGARVVSRQEFAGYWEYLLEDAIFTSPPYANFGGAALIGLDGKLLGIGSLYTQVAVPDVGSLPCNMFVPVDLLKPILTDMIETGRSKNPPKPWLGIYTQETHGRVFILRVTSEGPAETAGLQAGDIVLKVNQKPVIGLADFYRKVWALGKAGVNVPLSVLRETQIRDVVIQSSDRYQYLKLHSQRLGKGTI